MLGDAFEYLTDGASWSGSQGIGAFAVQQLLLTVTALALAMAIGLPLAVWAGHHRRGGFLAVNVSNVGRAVPVFAVLLILALGPVGSGQFGPYGRAGLATLVALVLFALPPLITNAYVAVTEVDRDVVEAARGVGMSGGQVFRSVELPLAMPVIMTGVRIALVQVWATATIAALVAGPGLGRIITRGFANQATYQVVAGAILVAIGALVLEGLAVLAERAVDPMRGVRRRGASGASGTTGRPRRNAEVAAGH
jgi:osmoprotectant transport system permease protein